MPWTRPMNGTDSFFWVLCGFEWASVARWLFRNGKLSRDAAIEAEIVRAANAAIASHEPRLRESLQKSLKSYEKSLQNEAA